MEAIRSSKTSVLTTTTRQQIPEDDFLHTHGRENLKSYKVKVTLRLAAYRQSVSLGVKPLEIHDYRFFSN
jgi:hypothetical protein